MTNPIRNQVRPPVCPREISRIISRATANSRQETAMEPTIHRKRSVKWPQDCIIGPGLEGAIACESRVGYVNGTKGRLIYRGYDIFDLCPGSSYEETCYLLLNGRLPTREQLETFKQRLISYRNVNDTIRLMMGFPIEKMNPMAALRLGTNLMRQAFTYDDLVDAPPGTGSTIGTDEDSIGMETKPRGEKHAIYEFKTKKKHHVSRLPDPLLQSAADVEACHHLIAGVPTIAAAVARIRKGKLPIEPDPYLGHAANFIYMMTGERPNPMEERVMDVAMILHADHGMNASTFAAMVVASTLSDIYFSIGSGIAALNGSLHGGANEQVLRMIREIGHRNHVQQWFSDAVSARKRIMGFGHRVYKVYDPRAKILDPLAHFLAGDSEKHREIYAISKSLEHNVISTLGKEKRIFPNVDFYSALVYHFIGIPGELFTSVFAASRVAGWTARVLEYLKKNRIFRPRAVYTGPVNRTYIPIGDR